MIGFVLPLVYFAQIDITPTPRVAQVRLAETLAEAESIESVVARGDRVTFVIVRDGEALDVTAETKRGDVIALSITPRAALPVQLHGLSWLGDELAEVTAVTRLAVDEDGAITIATDDGRRYMAIPGRGSGGAAARWAAAWN